MRHIVLLLVLIAAPAPATEPIRVAVAANFRSTLEHVNEQFQMDTGYQVVLSSGSTGVLYSQILHGAPYDLFFSADREAATKLKAGAPGATRGEPFCYARGSLVLMGGSGELAQLADSSLSLAIANPVTAPYGRAAIEVLARPEFSRGNSRKLVRGTNAVQAYQFWRSGAADLALLPRALALKGTPVPAQWHQPLEQYAISLVPETANPAIGAYLNWIRSDTVRTLISNAGYEPCP